MSNRQKPKRDIEERNNLILQWMPLVHNRVGKLRRAFPSLRKMPIDDCVSAGNDGLIRAAELYDPNWISPRTNKPVQFNTYAVRAIDQHILRELAKANIFTGMKHLIESGDIKNKDKNPFVKDAIKPIKSLNTRYSYGNSSGYNVTKSKSFDESDLIIQPKDKAPPVWELASHNLLVEEVQEKLNKIFPRYASVVRKKFFENKTLNQIGAELGITKERVRQMINDGIMMLKKAIGLEVKKICTKCPRPVKEELGMVTCEICRERRKISAKTRKRKRSGISKKKSNSIEEKTKKLIESGVIKGD